MRHAQARRGRARFTLRTERLGPLSLVNHFLTRLDLAAILARHVPTDDRRVAMPYADGLGILLRSILVEREPIYRQGETVRAFAAGLLGKSPAGEEFPRPVVARFDTPQSSRKAAPRCSRLRRRAGPHRPARRHAWTTGRLGLASQPTLSRFDNAVGPRELLAMGHVPTR